jgi:hypothetical protein
MVGYGFGLAVWSCVIYRSSFGSCSMVILPST